MLFTPIHTRCFYIDLKWLAWSPAAPKNLAKRQPRFGIGFNNLTQVYDKENKQAVEIVCYSFFILFL